jgi:hypothetical protein
MSKTVAFAACLVCVLVTVRSAKAFAESTPHVYTVLSLFAFSFALLLPYYGPPHLTTELPSAWAGFIVVYVGLLLRREAQLLEGQAEESIVHWADGLAVWLLALIAVPSVPIVSLFFAVQPETLILWIGFSLSLLADGLVTYGVRRLHQGRKAWLLMLAVVVFYSSLELAYAFRFYGGEEMSDSLRYLFSIAKCIYTGVFLLLVLSSTIPPTERLPWYGYVLKFIGVGGVPRAELVVDALDVKPSAATPGARVTVCFTLRNNGTARASHCIARIRLIPERNDTILGSLDVEKLAPTKAAQFEHTVTVPEGSLSGERYIAVTPNADRFFPSRDRSINQWPVRFDVLGKSAPNVRGASN